jgi:hypothetical protein
MVIACIALAVSLGGTSFAAVTLARNSVGTKQLKKNAVISSKVKNRSLLAVDFKSGQLPRGPQGPAGPTGATGATGAQGIQGPQGPGARWAGVNPDGTIALQSGGITVNHFSTGIYIVDFGSDVSRQLITVTPGTINDASFRGTVVSSSCAPPATTGGLIGCPATNPQNFVFVGELNSGDTAVGDHGFYVAAIGPTGTGPASIGGGSKAGPFAK